jgi:tripartite-type tricarboxylate transporter receptor subunit TctC
MFAQEAGVSFNHIPYKGSAQVVQAVRGKQVPMTFADSAAVIAQVNANALRPLAVTSQNRITSLPNVPTVAESGYPSYEMVLWSGLFAPAGISPDIVAKLQAAVQKAMKDPSMRSRLETLGVQPIGSTSAQLASTMKEQIAQYTEVAKKANIQISQ